MYSLCENSFHSFSQLLEKYTLLSVCIHYVKQFSRFFPTSGKNLVLSQAIYSPNLFCKECVENIKENWNVYNAKDLKMWSVTRIALWAVLWLQSFHFIDVSERGYVTYYRLFYFSKMNVSNFVAQDYTLASLEGDE